MWRDPAHRGGMPAEAVAEEWPTEVGCPRRQWRRLAHRGGRPAEAGGSKSARGAGSRIRRVETETGGPRRQLQSRDDYFRLGLYLGIVPETRHQELSTPELGKTVTGAAEVRRSGREWKNGSCALASARHDRRQRAGTARSYHRLSCFQPRRPCFRLLIHEIYVELTGGEVGEMPRSLSRSRADPKPCPSDPQAVRYPARHAHKVREWTDR
mmetsp:Transcript_1511/g.4167  ORF Transcript_1511/g.4167 Transcript_1511/m.4167 type:complete len:211 (+) Transcript_1511:93-725(+)